MNSFRDFVQKHISRPSLMFMLVFGFIALMGAGSTFIQNVDTAFADIDRDIAPSLHMAYVSANALNPRIPNTRPPFIQVSSKTLKLGDTGQDVLLLQSFLEWRGYWPRGEALSKYFGPTTEDAVRKYQVNNKLESEGVVGPQTRNAWKQDIEKAL